MTTARRLVVHGRVQGVWYRNWTVEAARDLGLTGWVRNHDDGTVEIHAEGEPDAIDRLIDLAQDGPPAADVERIDCAEAEPEGFESFAKRQWPICSSPTACS
ncbi:acylphosphatase [Novosphingopyxis sp. YJ-S2-01]|uniref:acylphosphatase n=1 Tax=Novosphingopyxis sp. YJ-S2-01 TaxID=2794021 RepID=UPI0018DC2F1C|nr:acylphosphatase [Novosphingopyxis sp. YJ-S2-01]MBH9537985.1 acylphosphatase [Novosphingopyxis sp. YJ-S2-01]